MPIILRFTDGRSTLRTLKHSAERITDKKESFRILTYVSEFINQAEL